MQKDNVNTKIYVMSIVQFRKIVVGPGVVCFCGGIRLGVSDKLTETPI